MIISFSGSKKVGKDESSKPLLEKGFQKLSFARPVKEICSNVFKIPYFVLDDPDQKDVKFKKVLTANLEHIQILIDELSDYQFISNKVATEIAHKVSNKTFHNPREILQFIGTDVVRELVDNDFWTNALKSRLEFYDNIVITDARFPNERQLLKDAGAYMIRVYRPGYEASTHISDNSLGLDSEYDAVLINDSTKEDLHNKVKTIYEQNS